ncbi:DUF742 domain-containing protein [Actinokineospora bangkokensis]|uniref:Multi-component regulatory system-8 n=1 Tax=Actinokineospora bangkokensis TaxID=1193682 RepID=A0A1Q9LQI7_9PSEU|nr:DUF742 domain-containing protein [Actinokineospora bangkokensis]OLR94282.1 hypothetical protein BJP25_10925 [Actinokineospora bangkokensis]
MAELPDRGFADVLNGFTLGHHAERPAEEVPAPPPAAPVGERGVLRVEPEWPRVEACEPVAAETTAIVRPYAWTRGRTRSAFDLRVETMVSTGERTADAAAFAESEHREIAVLCRDPRSVAEVATLMGAPLGVAKVLLGDMAQLGLVVVHKTAAGGANRAHLVLMERVLSGLRRL